MNMEQQSTSKTLAEIEAHYQQQVADLRKQSRDIINKIRLLAEFVGMPFDESLQDDFDKMTRTNTPA